MMLRFRKNKKSGVAVVIVLGILLLFTVVALFFTRQGSSLIRSVGLRFKHTKADYVAEEALKRGLVKIQMVLKTADGVQSPPMEPNVVFNPHDADYDPALTASGEDYVDAKQAYRYWVKDQANASSADHEKDFFEVRYKITSAPGWTTNPVLQSSEKTFQITASVRGPSGLRSILSQDVIVRRDSFAKYLVFTKEFWGHNGDHNDVTVGNIRTNGDAYLEVGRHCNGTGTWRIIGSITAGGHIMRGVPYMTPDNNNHNCDDTYPLAYHGNLMAPDYSKIQIIDRNNSNRYGYLYAQGTRPAPQTGDEPLPPNAPTDLSHVGSDAIRVLDPANFDGSQLGDSDTYEGVTWEVDTSKWNARAEQVFNKLLVDKELGATKIEPPDPSYLLPTGFFAANSDLTFETRQNGANTEVVVTNSSGSILVDHLFDTTAVGRLDITQAQAKYDYATPTGDTLGTHNGTVVYDYATNATVNTRVGNDPVNTLGPVAGFTGDPAYPNCFQAFRHGRIFSRSEDGFMYVTEFDLQQIKDKCLPPNPQNQDIRIYAKRSDAVEDQTILDPTSHNGFSYSVDENRNYSGYAMKNAETLPFRSFAYVSPHPLLIIGSFNQHLRTTGPNTGETWLKDSNGNGLPDIDDDPSYDPTNPTIDAWKPALIAADKVIVATADPELYEKMNRFRYSDGANLEFTAKRALSSGPNRCIDINCQVPDATISPSGQHFLETNAIVFGSYTTPRDNRHGRSDAFSQQQDFIDPQIAWYMRGSFLDLFRSKYATQYGRDQCDSRFWEMMDVNGLCKWSKGDENDAIGLKSSPKLSRDWATYRSHEENLNNGYPIPSRFREIIPGGEAAVKPFEVKDWVRVDGIDTLFD